MAGVQDSGRVPSGHVDDDALDGVVRVAADVPRAVERLLVAGLVARADAELVAAERRVPLVRPRRPRPRRADVVLDARRLPRLATVEAHLDRRHPRPTRPGTPAQRARSRLEE